MGATSGATTPGNPGSAGGAGNARSAEIGGVCGAEGGAWLGTDWAERPSTRIGGTDGGTASARCLGGVYERRGSNATGNDEAFSPTESTASA